MDSATIHGGDTDVDPDDESVRLFRPKPKRVRSMSI